MRKFSYVFVLDVRAPAGHKKGMVARDSLRRLGQGSLPEVPGATLMPPYVLYYCVDCFHCCSCLVACLFFKTATTAWLRMAFVVGFYHWASFCVVL